MILSSQEKLAAVQHVSYPHCDVILSLRVSAEVRGGGAQEIGENLGHVMTHKNISSHNDEPH